MARRTGRRDRDVRGIPGVVADRGAGAARDGRWPGCYGWQRAQITRVPTGTGAGLNLYPRVKN
jgi:hypothetical protein